MSKLASAIYKPPQDGLPYLAVVFVDGRIIACQPASTPEEAEAMVVSAMEDLPEIVAQANQDQDDADKDRIASRKSRS